MRIILSLMAFAAFFALPTPLMAAARQEPVDNLPQWHDFSNRQNQTLAALAACEKNQQACSSQEIKRWAKLVGDLKSQNRLRQIITVNRWFNRLPYKHDEYAYNTLDYWADTAQLLKSRGDCEDYALSKYYTLRRLGFSPEEMKIMVVYDQYNYANHAVLMVYIDGSRFMLDINADDTSPGDMDGRYQPIYGFNEQTAWFY